jgi:hypothetical protein
MATYVRKRNAVLAIKQETTPGDDIWAGGMPTLATDYMRADVSIALNQSQVANTELIGSLDDAPPIPAGTKATVTVTCMARGSGTVGTPARWGTLMKACSYKEVIVPAVVATAATAASTNSVTLGAPYVATDALYQGSPVTLAVNPATPITTWVTDYTAGVAALSSTFTPALDNTTTVALPSHIKYVPTSDNTLITPLSMLVLIDGLAWRFVGCLGTWTLDIQTGGAGTFKFTMQGIFSGAEAQAFPTGFAADTNQPPIFIDSQCRLNGAVLRVSKVTLDAGVTVQMPDNPEAELGFDPGIITVRNSKGSVDPLMSVTDTLARTAAFLNGSISRFGATLGNTVGNRVGVVTPQILYSGMTPGDRNLLMAETLPFSCIAPDAGIILVTF